MATKHNQIIRYIESLAVGDKISVRGIAKLLHLSEGTAYRAIKDAEMKGLVSTIERVGTIRIEQQQQQYLADHLTYKEMVHITQATVLAGDSGLNRTFKRFIIGAMTTEAIEHYLSADALMIVGNREEVQLQALRHNMAVLITGGFTASSQVIELANERELPLISTTFDTFTVASMINQGILDQTIKQEIITVNDVFRDLNHSHSLTIYDTIKEFHNVSKKTGLSRFPIVQNGRLVGVVTAKDLIGCVESTPLEKVMTRNPIFVKPYMSLATVSHKMVWEDLEMFPVVEDNMDLLGVISRQEVMKNMQNISMHAQSGHTYQETITAHLNDYSNDQHSLYDYFIVIQPPMVNSLGTISYGVLSELITTVAEQKIMQSSLPRHVLEKLDLHYFQLIQLGNVIQFAVTIFYNNRRTTLLQVDVFHENTIIAKAILTMQSIE